MEDTLIDIASRVAYDLGVKSGKSCANWHEQDLFGGRYTGDTRKAAQSVIDAMDNGEFPFDGLPNLSGEYADGPTPKSVFSDILYKMRIEEDSEQAAELDEFLDDLCESWESGVMDGYSGELYRLATEAAA